MHRERPDHNRRNDCSAADCPKDGLWSPGRLLQQADDIGPENGANPPNSQFHAYPAGTKACLVRVGGKIVEDVLGPDDAKARNRHDRQIEPVPIDKHQRADGKATDEGFIT